MAFPLSEKTLEQNVLENMINDIRHHIDPAAYIYGFSLKYESVTGLDSSLSVPGNPLMLAFQFKKCFDSTASVYRFHFNNNSYRDQHNFLYFSAVSVSPPPVVFYALPAIVDIHQLSSVAPNFLDRTYLLDPMDIGPIFGSRIHEIHLDTSTCTCNVLSDVPRSGIKLRRWEDIMPMVGSQDIGVTTEKFVERLRKMAKEDIGIKLKRPNQKRWVFLRSLMVPSSPG